MKNIPLDAVQSLLEDAKRVQGRFQNALNCALKSRVALEIDEYTERNAAWLKIVKVLDLSQQGSVFVDEDDLWMMRFEIAREITARKHAANNCRKKLRFRGGEYFISELKKAEARRDSMLKMQRFFDEYFSKNLFA
jgi:hypothetical protein